MLGRETGRQKVRGGERREGRWWLGGGMGENERPSGGGGRGGVQTGARQLWGACNISLRARERDGGTEGRREGESARARERGRESDLWTRKR